jgi:type IV pilus assembly protein PilN
MIRINLLPIKQAAQAERQRQEILRAGLLLVLLIAICFLVRIKLMHDLDDTNARIASVEESLKSLETQVRDVKDLESKKKALDSKLKVIADLGKKRVGPVGVMTNLAKATPDRVWLTDFTETGGNAMITGQAIDNQIVAEFLRNLSASRYFPTVDLVETQQDQIGENKLRKFIVKAMIDYAAAETPPKADAAAAAKADSGAKPEEKPQG